MITQAIWIAQT